MDCGAQTGTITVYPTNDDLWFIILIYDQNESTLFFGGLYEYNNLLYRVKVNKVGTDSLYAKPGGGMGSTSFVISKEHIIIIATNRGFTSKATWTNSVDTTGFTLIC